MADEARAADADPDKKDGKEGQGGARPAFARDFPRDPELDALVTAFEAGNFAEVRQGAARVAASGAEDPVKRAAAVLLERTRPDPLAKLLLVVTAVLLFALSVFWITHDGPKAPP